jgi:hypothetical protein
MGPTFAGVWSRGGDGTIRDVHSTVQLRSLRSSKQTAVQWTDTSNVDQSALDCRQDCHQKKESGHPTYKWQRPLTTEATDVELLRTVYTLGPQKAAEWAMSDLSADAVRWHIHTWRRKAKSCS